LTRTWRPSAHLLTYSGPSDSVSIRIPSTSSAAIRSSSI
jgi:hypothetical protein